MQKGCGVHMGTKYAGDHEGDRGWPRGEVNLTEEDQGGKGTRTSILGHRRGKIPLCSEISVYTDIMSYGDMFTILIYVCITIHILFLVPVQIYANFSIVSSKTPLETNLRYYPK